jgi:hypothetical protein
MTTRKYSSTAQPTTLAAGCTDSATSIQVAATTGFPAVDFTLALDYGAAGQEVVLVTNVSGTTLTVTRGYDSTPASAHSLGAVVRHVHVGKDFGDSRTHEAASSGVHGLSGSVVGTTDTQAVSNKDLSSGNTFPSTLTTNSGAQTLTNKDLSSGTNTFPATLATDAEVTSAVSTHAALTATHGATGAVVGTTNTQTLTNKTLTSPTINDPTFGGDFVGKVSYVEKTLDESLSSSTTYQDDNELTVAVTASHVYELKLAVRFTGTTNTSGLKLQLTLPAGATYSDDEASPVLASGPIFIADNAPATPNDVFSSGSASYVKYYRIKIDATAGSVTLQWAQHTSSGSAVVGKAGSYLTLRRVA